MESCHFDKICDSNNRIKRGLERKLEKEGGRKGGKEREQKLGQKRGGGTENNVRNRNASSLYCVSQDDGKYNVEGFFSQYG